MINKVICFREYVEHYYTKVFFIIKVKTNDKFDKYKYICK